MTAQIEHREYLRFNLLVPVINAKWEPGGKHSMKAAMHRMNSVKKSKIFNICQERVDEIIPYTGFL